ncbi:TonB-dependent receptor [Bacteroidia bacterium]|nr:TonB-dependent receptor [Bacteroidia bacterium]
MVKKIYSVLVLLLAISQIYAQTGSIAGKIFDKKTGESIIGATILVANSNLGAVSDIDGKFAIAGVPAEKQKIRVSCIAYKSLELDAVVSAEQTTEIALPLEEDSKILTEVAVVASRKMNSEIGMLNLQKTALNVVSGVSSQQIAKTQDKDASEAIRRIPGISILDNRFIVARGLSQRYNNAWVNNNAVPSSEADSRSFSFDMIPSGQIENILIVKSPVPELPADFTGGFVKISTKNMPSENTFQISYGIGLNTRTHFRDFKSAKGSATDFLGFDNGFRAMRDVVPEQRMNNQNADIVSEVSKNGFNNNWKISTHKPIPDQKLSLALNRFRKIGKHQLGLVAALNYSYSSQTYTDMKNARFGVYNKTEDAPVMLYDYTDNQYTATAKIGALLNLTWLAGNNRFELRNIFNQMGRDRYTERSGWRNVSSLNMQKKDEYFYNSRTTYTGQISGNHTAPKSTSGGQSKFDWTLGYAYANKNQPDRRQIEREEETANPNFNGKYYIDQNDIIRDFNFLAENMFSLTANYQHDFVFGSFKPTLKAGVYSEYRTRNYTTRYFMYRLVKRGLPDNFQYRDVATEILQPENFAADKMYIYDDSDRTNNYNGNAFINSGYVGVNIPITLRGQGGFNVYAGVRYEHNRMSLDNYVAIALDKKETKTYRQSDFFPSINATYNFNKKHLLRAAYGKSINRQEFREVSKSTYYDFDLFSYVRGNQDLKPAYIHNVDLRYEFYPTESELISVSLFFKHFLNPIEWTYLDAGGTYTFTFENADKANNYGIELDIKKSLDFIGMKNFSLSFNGAIIGSKVFFGENSFEHNRPMQGQSPYIVNFGLFYQTEKISAGIMYNLIGRRIVGIGRSENSDGKERDNDVPDMYEIERNVIDLSFGYKISKRFEISAGVRDLLAQPLVFKQFPTFTDSNGALQTRQQTTKKYKTGQNFSVSFKVNF